MDQTADSSHVIVKQEVILDDLELTDYQHLLTEYYDEQPDEDDTFEVKVEVPDLDEPADAVPDSHVDWQFRCDVCKVSFATATSFEQHNATEHPYTTLDSTRSWWHAASMPFERGPDSLFSCDDCGKQFERENSFMVHVQRHRNVESKRFSCKPCMKSFTTKYYFHKHNEQKHGIALERPRRKYKVRVEPELSVPLDQTSRVGRNIPLTIRAVSPDLDGSETLSIPDGFQEYDSLLETFDETIGQQEDVPREDALRSVIVKEEFVMDDTGFDHDETSLVDVLHYNTAADEFPAPTVHHHKKRPEAARKCPVCKAWYHTVAGMEKHMKTHEPNQSKNVKRSKSKSGSEEFFSVLVVKEEPNEGDSSFVDLDHSYAAVGVSRSGVDLLSNLHCERCDKTFPTKLQHKKHEERHTNIDTGRYRCELCSKSLGSKQALALHEKSSHRLQNHLRSQHKQNSSKGLKCETSPELSELVKPCLVILEDVHIKQEPKLEKVKRSRKGQRQCPICREWFASEEERKIHYLQIHNPKGDFSPKKELQDQQKNSRTGKRGRGKPSGHRLCPLCKKRFPSEAALRDHFPIHSRKQPATELAESQPKEETETDAETSQEDVSASVAENNSTVDVKPVRYCARCDKTFLTDSSYAAHELRHKNIDSGLLRCRTCAKTFGIKTELDLHELNAHGRRKVGRPRKVPLPNEIKQESKLLRRESGRTRNGWQLKKTINKSLAYCARCDKSFLTYKQYKFHNLRHRNKDSGRFRCHPCRKSFGCKQELKQHRQQGHKLKSGRPSIVERSPELETEHTLSEPPAKKRKRGRPKGSRDSQKRKPVRKIVGRQKQVDRKNDSVLQDQPILKGKVGRPKKEDPEPTKTDSYCARCDKQFGFVHLYANHKVRHKNIDSARFRCRQCSKLVGSKSELILHERSKHTGRVGRPKGIRKCPLCKGWFLSAEEFKDHLRSHIQS